MKRYDDRNPDFPENRQFSLTFTAGKQVKGENTHNSQQVGRL